MRSRAILGVWAIVLCGAPMLRAAPTSQPAAKTFDQAVARRATAILDTAEATGDLAAAADEAMTLFDQVIAYAPDKSPASFRESDFVRRLTLQLAHLAPAEQRDTLRFLRKNQNLAHALAFAIKPEDDPVAVYKVLRALRDRDAALLERFADLAAAVCVVHDQPLKQRLNENVVTAPDPVGIFEYFVANERRMLFGLENVPVAMLIHVVDTTATVDELAWAGAKYANDQNIGARFFDISYDHDAVNRGTTKKITELGVTLPNIKQYGGVCIDQAYYAAEVGKAIGVPTAIVIAEAGVGGHAWIGFLQFKGGRSAAWNFDSGRYPAFQGIAGVANDPQMRRDEPDAQISLSAELIGTTAADRESETAYCDAALRLLGLLAAKRDLVVERPESFPGASGAPGVSPTPRRKAVAVDALTLVERGLDLCPGDADGWRVLRAMAERGWLTLEDKRRAAGALEKFCGAKYPDFVMTVLRPMIKTVDDPQAQNDLWNAAFNSYHQRVGLAAIIRLEQGRMWEKAGDRQAAGQCYEEVIKRYADAGPWVLDALQRAEALLSDRGATDHARVVALYEEAWSRIPQPKALAEQFLQQTMWYQVGELYAQKLADAGDVKRADAVRARLAGLVAAPRK